MENNTVLIDSANKQWSIDFVKKFFSFTVCYDGHSEGLNKMENIFKNREGELACAECAYGIFSYDDMMWDNMGQDICKPNEVVLSQHWPGEKEYMQVLTYDQLKEIVITVLREEPNGDEQIKEFVKRAT